MPPPTAANRSPNPGRKKSGRSKADRLSREDWLSAGLEALAQGGPRAVRIDPIAAGLDVTKGSFYWHFKDRDEYVQSMARYWVDEFTEEVVRHAGSSDGATPETKLRQIAEQVVRGERAKFAIAIRSWAARDEIIAAAVAEVDAMRYKSVRALFAEIGFTGDELEMRVRTFLVYYSFESSFGKGQSKAERLRHLRLRHELLVHTG